MKKIFSKKVVYVLIAIALPVCVYADPFNLSGSTFKGVVCYVVSLIEIINPILFFLAFVFFFWGLSKFIINSSGNEKELQTGKNYMLWGILALFILVSVQALVGIVTNEFGFGNGIQSGFPYLPGTGNAGVGCNFNTTSSANINFGDLAPTQTNP